MTAIYKREPRSYFNSMTGWIVLAAMTAFIGIYFLAYNLSNGYAYFSYALSAAAFLFTVLVPLLTTRSMAEERRSRADQLLLTSPASIPAVVLGKYFSMVTVMAAALVGFYAYDSAKFAGLLPDALGRFSLMDAFAAFANDHVFDLRGLPLYLSLTALALFLTCQVPRKRRWN